MQKKITRFKKQPDVDERRVQFPSVRNGREMMMFLVKIGKAGEKKKKNSLRRTFTKVAKPDSLQKVNSNILLNIYYGPWTI